MAQQWLSYSAQEDEQWTMVMYSQGRDYLLYNFAQYITYARGVEIEFSTDTFEGNFYGQLRHRKQQLIIGDNQDIS